MPGSIYAESSYSGGGGGIRTRGQWLMSSQRLTSRSISSELRRHQRGSPLRLNRVANGVDMLARRNHFALMYSFVVGQGPMMTIDEKRL